MLFKYTSLAKLAEMKENLPEKEYEFHIQQIMTNRATSVYVRTPRTPHPRRSKKYALKDITNIAKRLTYFE